MNIKLVIDQKIHKVPKDCNNYEEINKIIQQIQPSLLDQGYILFVKLHPNYSPILIENSKHFEAIKNYFKEGTIKILVKKANESITYEEMNQLNQSVAHIFQSQQRDLNTQNNSFSELKLSREQQFTEDDKLKNFIIQQVDERLLFHKLKEQQQENKLIIISCPEQILISPGKGFFWRIEIKNAGKIQWKKGEVYLQCIQGPYVGNQTNLYRDVDPDQVIDFSNRDIAPKNITEVECKYKMFLNGQSFGDEISFKITTKRQEKVQGIKKIQNINEMDLKEQSNLYRFMEITGADEEETKQFLQLFEGSQLEVDDLINKYYGS